MAASCWLANHHRSHIQSPLTAALAARKEFVVPKQKTHRGAAKRFKVTAGGKVRRNHSMKSHILTKKTTKRKRRLRKSTNVVGKFARTIKSVIGG